jgi:CheY-like chemotaxis protein
MEGRYWLESEPGVGSTFHITVRFEKADGACVRWPAGLEQQRVLIVDDNETNRRSLEEMVRSWRMRPVTVADCATALAQLHQACDSGDRFALALLDSNMPEVNGLQLAAKIKEDPLLHDLPLVMLSSSDHRDDASRRRDLHLQGFLTKPVKPSELMETIVAAIGLPQDEYPVEKTAEPDQPPVPSLRILLTEDNVVNQQLALTLLRKAGHEVTLAVNGRQAIELLHSQSFDVVLRWAGGDPPVAPPRTATGRPCAGDRHDRACHQRGP